MNPQLRTRGLVAEAGVGLEFLFRTNFRFRLDWGFPLKDLPSAGVEVGDERLYVSGTITF